jgi:hypothetical protein
MSRIRSSRDRQLCARVHARERVPDGAGGRYNLRISLLVPQPADLRTGVSRGPSYTMLDGRTKTDRYLQIFLAVRDNRRICPTDQIVDSRFTEVCRTEVPRMPICLENDGLLTHVISYCFTVHRRMLTAQ